MAQAVRPPLAAPDLWIVMDATTSNKDAAKLLEDWSVERDIKCNFFVYYFIRLLLEFRLSLVDGIINITFNVHFIMFICSIFDYEYDISSIFPPPPRLRQLPFPCCKPKSGNHTPESYRDSVLRRSVDLPPSV